MGTNTEAEAGANSGAPWTLVATADDGSFLNSAIFVPRIATAIMFLQRPVTVTGAFVGQSTITGTTLNATTGINTGAGAGTQRIDAAGVITGTTVNADQLSMTDQVISGTATDTDITIDPSGTGSVVLASGAGLKQGTTVRLSSTGRGTLVGVTNSGTYVPTPLTAIIDANSDQVPCTAELIYITLDMDHTLTSTPTIPAGTEGQVLRVFNKELTRSLTLQDNGTLAGSLLILGAATYTILPGKSALFIYATGFAESGCWLKQ